MSIARRDRHGGKPSIEEGHPPSLEVEQYETYEDYLDSQLTETDLYYLEDEEMARQLVELGYRGVGDAIRRDDFEARRKILHERTTQKSQVPRQLAGAAHDLTNLPFLQALANREELVRSVKLTTIIFIRDYNSKGQEISGYIDYTHRLKTENFDPYFQRRKRFLPRPTDLSYYNWETQIAYSNSSPNFQVITESETGLLFKNKRDRKVINVDPEAHAGDNTTRTDLRTDEYVQVVLFDHMTRRKT